MLNRSLKFDFGKISSCQLIVVDNHLPRGIKDCVGALCLPEVAIERAIHLFQLPVTFYNLCYSLSIPAVDPGGIRGLKIAKTTSGGENGTYEESDDTPFLCALHEQKLMEERLVGDHVPAPAIEELSPIGSRLDTKSR